MSAEQVIRNAAARGLYHFDTTEAKEMLGVSLTATRSALRRLKKKGLVASPFRGFHVFVPPEYQAIECLPADQFVPQLMDELGLAYYAGLLTAARYHGAAHQKPQIFQVVVAKNRAPIHCGKVRVSFVARHNVSDMPVQRLNTRMGYLHISSPEATAFDLVGYPKRAGGLNNVATVLVELAEKIDPEQLADIAPLSPLPWAQRLGHLLEFLEYEELTESLYEYVTREVTETSLLSPRRDVMGARDPRWKLRINVDVEPDL